MARYTCTVNSPLSPQEAFDYMADLRNFIEWDPGVSSAAIQSGEPGPDSAYDVTANGADLVYKTVEYDRPQRVVVEAVTKLLRSYDVITVTERDDGSAVHYDATLELNGLLKIGDPIMSLIFRRIGDAAAGGLERVLDGHLVRPG